MVVFYYETRPETDIDVVYVSCAISCTQLRFRFILWRLPSSLLLVALPPGGSRTPERYEQCFRHASLEVWPKSKNT